MSSIILSEEREELLKKFRKNILNRFAFGWYMFVKLPAAWMAGVRVKDLTKTTCKVSVPYKWLSQNPFRSTYFACLAMAGEMAGGLLAMMYTYQSKPPMSLLVVKLEATFSKKATNITTFTCSDGDIIHKTIQESIETGEGKTVQTESIGHNESGDEVARFLVTWSFKPKGSKK